MNDLYDQGSFVPALIGSALAILLLFFAVIAVSGLTVKLMDRQKLQSQCPALIETYQSTGVPAHLTIKCREFLQ